MTAAAAHPRATGDSASPPPAPAAPIPRSLFSRSLLSRSLPFLAVASLCALIYLPFLGATGFSSTEGHRVIPAWEMLESGDYLLTRMFDQIYLRKPPGMPWAIALSSAIFGQTEFAARLPAALSITALALLTTFFASKWFGGRGKWGTCAGLASALLPMHFSSGRAAEIEALNHCATGASILLLIHLLIARRNTPLAKQVPIACAAGLAITLAALAKGPAGFAAIGMTIPAAAIITRSWRTLFHPALAFTAAIPTVLLLALLLAIARAVEASGQTPVLQGVTDFLWPGRNLTLHNFARVFAMPPSAFIAALPVSLALLFIWPRTRANAQIKSQDDQRASDIAGAIALAAILSILLLALLGVQNPRYAQPCLVTLPILIAWLARSASVPRSGSIFGPIRRRALAILFPLRGIPWLILLLITAALYITWYEPLIRNESSGRIPGEKLAQHLPHNAIIWADRLIEARPEVLLYAQRQAAIDGRTINIRWIPDLAQRLQNDLTAPDGTYLLLRDDATVSEPAALTHLAPHLTRITEGKVHKFDFALYRIQEKYN